MKKLIIAIVGALTIVASCGGTALAMTDQGPNGTKVNGIYKDNFTVYIQHGNQGCGGAGTYFKYTYTATADGTHQYQFYADINDNPYVMLDQSNDYIPLNTTCGSSVSVGGSTHLGLTLVDQFSATIDNRSPNASITSPGGATTTSANSFDISGYAADPENNLTQVRTLINGAPGPYAPVSGNTFSVGVPLNMGSNSVQVIAYDSVGHTTTSNTVVITRSGSSNGGSSGGSSGGSTGGTSLTGTGSTGTSSGSSSSASGGGSSTGSPVVKFNPAQILNLTDPYAGDKTSQPLDVQETAAIAGITGKTYDLLVLVLIVLVALCLFVINRFRPIFAELDKNRSGLRKRIIIIVTLPSLLPLLGLGVLGYQQLSLSVKNSLSSQLEKAAQTSSLKLSREFSIRGLVITKTSSDILQIQQQYQSQQQQLVQQKSTCSQLLATNTDRNHFENITSNDNCLPFLSAIAQVAVSGSSKTSDFQNALNEGETQAGSDLTAQENQRVTELLGSVRDFFPDVLEVDIVAASDPSKAAAVLPRTDAKQQTTLQAHKNLLALSLQGNLAVLDKSGGNEQLYLTYPITSGKTKLGGVVMALDLKQAGFVPAIWSSTPKPYDTDQTFFMTTDGQLIIPLKGKSPDHAQLVKLSKNAPGKVMDMSLDGQDLATRTSPVSNTNWVVAVGAPAKSILTPLAGVQRTAILAIAGFILLSLLLGIWFVSGIAGEIEKLLQGALTFAKGNLDFKIKLKSHDEIQVLGDTMNQMAADIKTAQAALVEKDKEFINIATHELKAPMTSIIGNLSMVIEDGMGQVDSTARELIDQSYQGTIRLRDIVTDMLDVARLESGHAEFKLVPLDITAITKDIVGMQSVPAQQADVKLAYDGSTQPKVIADKSKLQIIITNFISNAIKYNRKGGTITISHTVEDDKLVTSVADTGLGIPEDQQPHIFEKFYRVQHSDRENVPGTGLGMYITRQFIEAMGGSVSFTSVHGQGTTFRFSLPLEIKNNAAAAPTAPNPTAPTSPVPTPETT